MQDSEEGSDEFDGECESDDDNPKGGKAYAADDDEPVKGGQARAGDAMSNASSSERRTPAQERLEIRLAKSTTQNALIKQRLVEKARRCARL